VPDGPASGRASRRYPYYRIFVDLRFRTGTKKLHCEVALSGRVQERVAMKTERSQGQHQATTALALSIAGVILAMLIWSLMMLLWY
jgi:hypothetical protein